MAWAALASSLEALASSLEAQVIRGRIVDATHGQPIALGGALLLDRDQNPVAEALADSVGRFVLAAPGAGEYYLVGHSLGYSQTVSSLLGVGEDEYSLELELEPDPFQFDPLEVTVRNEELVDWFRLNFQTNPKVIPGFRAIQGADLEVARRKAKDNTDLFRWLYIPVSHARTTCLGYDGTRLNRATGRMERVGCGKLLVDGYELPAEHLETIDARSIAVVVVVPPNVMVFTRGYEWGFAPGGR